MNWSPLNIKLDDNVESMAFPEEWVHETKGQRTSYILLENAKTIDS